MAYAFLGSVSAGSSDNSTVTTGELDTSGADLLVAIIVDDSVDAISFTDSQSNTWSVAVESDTTNPGCRIRYVQSPTTAADHTFSVTATSDFPAIAVYAFSGSTPSPADQTNFNSAISGATSGQPGSITPTENNELVVSGIGISVSGAPGAGVTASGMSVEEFVNHDGSNYGLASAYVIQTTAAAINPTWSWNNSGNADACIVSFKAASTASVPTISSGAIAVQQRRALNRRRGF